MTPWPVRTGAALYRTTVSHERVGGPVHHAFRYRQPMWLVDLDALPRLPRRLRFLLAFEARDHAGDPEGSIRENVDRVLADHGIPRPHRVLMLANPRSFGHVFNPLTVYWAQRDDGTQHALVAEVHNTYGGRHLYVLRPDRAGRAGADKELYVSPFFPVDGRYEMQCTAPGAELQVGITLHREGRTAFRAVLTAGPPAPVRSVVATALRHPASSWWVSARIRAQGLRLWWRGVPVVPRPSAGGA